MNDLSSCGILAASGVCVPWENIPLVRKNPGSHRGESLAAHVRLSDEQTVLGLAAVAQTIEVSGWQDRSFANWAVIASARWFGRLRFTASLERYRKLNARGKSPLIVPTLSLHAIAGTLSIALGVHGPHFGVSGQEDQLGEALMAGLGMIERERIEGIWVVACEFDPEPIGDDRGTPTAPTVGYAAALALSSDAGSMRLTMGPGSQASGTVHDLVDWLQSARPGVWRCGVAGVGVVEARRQGEIALRKAG
jgi:hypothetical protein